MVNIADRTTKTTSDLRVLGRVAPIVSGQSAHPLVALDVGEARCTMREVVSRRGGIAAKRNKSTRDEPGVGEGSLGRKEQATTVRGSSCRTDTGR